MRKYRYLPLLVLGIGALALWPCRHQLTAGAIAARSPENMVPAICFLLVLYAVKSLSVVFPLSALEAAGGLLFPLPLALTVNFLGVLLVQILPYLLGRRQQGDLSALTRKYPRLTALQPGENPGRTVFLLRLAGVSPGDLVSLYLGAAGVPFFAYFTGGALGSFPRVASATLLGAALWNVGSSRFYLSLLPGAALTVLSLLLWKLRQ